jgi:rhodanese-related sulfurtransferase
MGAFLKHLLALLMIIIPTLLFAGQAPTVCHNELSAWLKTKQAISLVDIQDPAGFRDHNYDGSIAAGTNPGRLKKIAARLQLTKGKVILVSATGGADASKAVELLVRGGVQRSRILVLEGGMEAAAKNADCDCCKPSALSGASK